jgi:hypothetical protein
MNLGLLNILMAQQVDKPDYSKIADNAVQQAKDIGEKKFKEHLYVPHKPAQKNDNPVNNVTHNLTYENNKAPKSIKANEINASANTDTSVVATAGTSVVVATAGTSVVATTDTNVVATVGTNSVVAQVNKLEAKNSGTLQTEKEGLTQVFNALKGLQDKGISSDNNVLSTLLALQENNSPDTSVITNVDTAIDVAQNNDLALGISEALKGTNGDLQNAISDLVSNLSDTKKDANEGLGQNTISKDDKKDITTDTTAQNTPTITAVAATIINIAKTEAETPNVVETEVKSGQVDSLLKAGKDDSLEDSKKTKTDNVSGDKNTNTVNTLATAENNGQNNDKQNHNNGNTQLANEQLTQNIISADTTTAKAVAPTAKPADDSKTSQGLDTLLQASLNNDATISDQNFVKFQKYLDAVGTAQSDLNNDQVKKAQDIIAQIKFGVSSLAGKADNTISIQLHPKDLGSIDIRMEINSEGKTKVSIMAEKTDTLNLLQKEAPSLKGMLQDALKTDSSQMNFSFHDRNDDQWKQMIHDAFRNTGNGSREELQESINPAIYQQRFTAIDGLDIRV